MKGGGFPEGTGVREERRLPLEKLLEAERGKEIPRPMFPLLEFSQGQVPAGQSGAGKGAHWAWGKTGQS